MHQKIKSLLEKNDLCVLATMADTAPHCSLMSYAAAEDGREIYMVTHKNTRKYKNLEINPAVSLLIDSRETDREERRGAAKALTVTGTYEKIMDEPKAGEIRKLFLDRHPHLKGFSEDPQAQFILIRVKAFQLLEGIADAYFEEVN